MDMVKIFKKIILYTFLLFSVFSETKATHMVGGDFSYKSLGKGLFEITLTIRRDCEFGAPDAFFDEKAIIAVFNQNGSFMKEIGHRGGFFLDYIGNDTLNESLDVKCGVLGAPVCVHEAVYKDTIFLPRPKDGEKYLLVYQRCCRNQTLLNITDPLETGGSYILEIDQFAFDERNNSPHFKKWPDIYVCANQSLNFDHSAVEFEGDSLVYRLYAPSSGATITYPMPTVENPSRYTPFFNTVNWAPGYSLTNILGGSDPLKINPKTGLITGTPDKIGQFVVGVLVEEYRNGKLISIVRRDFEYNVRPCVEPPQARFESIETVCGSGQNDTISLLNTSTFAESYRWEIYVHSTKEVVKFTTKNVDYIYTLPAGGKDTFDITLEAYHSIPNCSDFFTKSVIVIGDPLVVDFEYKIVECLDDKLVINLIDKFDELNDLYTFESNKWNLFFSNDTIITTGNNVNVEIPKEEQFSIQLEVFTIENCDNSIRKLINYDIPDITFLANPVIVCEGTTAKIVKNPNSAWTYSWFPSEGLTFSSNDKSDPLFIGDSGRKYYVTITDGLCFHYDSVEVKVKDYFSIKIEGPDTVCVNQVQLKGVGVPADETDAILQWSKDRSFSSIMAVGSVINVTLQGRYNKFYLRVKPGTGCSDNIDSIIIYNGYIDLEFDKEITYCYKNLTKIEVINKTPDIGVNFSWKDISNIIVGPKDKSSVLIYTEEEGEFFLIFTATSDWGCDYTDTIYIFSKPGNKMEIKSKVTCGSFEMCFEVTGGTVKSYNWEITDANSDVIKFTTATPCYDFKQIGIFKVFVEIEVDGCDGNIIIETEVEVPKMIEIKIDKDKLTYCKGETLELEAKVNVESTIYWYTDNSNLIGVGDKISYKPSGTENITIVGVDKYDCKDTANIQLNEYKFDLNYINPGVVCKGDTIVLEIINKADTDLTYEWVGDGIISGGNTGKAVVVVEKSGTYDVKIIDDEYGCDTVMNVSVTMSDIDVSLIADTAIIVITNTVNLEVLNVPANSTIQWSTGEKNVSKITFTPQSTTGGIIEELITICVTVIDQYGCQDSACVQIKVIDPPCNEEDIYFPNAFSPNSDGANDLFRPRGKYIRNIKMEIYDRWGELIFRGDGDRNFGWNGTYKNKELTPDSYTYMIFVQCEDTDDYSKVSNVSLIK